MKMEKKKLSRTMLFMLIVLSVACKKDIVADVIQPGEPASEVDRHAVAILKEVGDILEEVYRDPAAIDEVNATIYSGFYEDERVLLKDLLFPETSQLYESASFKKLKVDTGVFRKVFVNALVRGKYPLITADVKPLLNIPGSPGGASNNSQIPDYVSVISGDKPVAIYFPYSDRFPQINLSRIPADNKIAVLKKPTIVYSDRDANQGKGRDPYYCLDAKDKTCYRDVIVDDNYAYSKATHIITVGATMKVPVPEARAEQPVYRVYHGSSRLTSQLDHFISFTGNGGGSEMKICRINGYLRRSDEHIDDFAGDVVTVHYTRGEIRNKTWKRVYSVWDPNWNYQDIEQIYAVYEEDNRGVKTIDGSLKTTLKIPKGGGTIEGDIGFKIQTQTQDQIITQRKIDRKSYLRDGLNNQGWGFLPDNSDFLAGNRDWPIFDGGSIWQYTFPNRIY